MVKWRDNGYNEMVEMENIWSEQERERLIRENPQSGVTTTTTV